MNRNIVLKKGKLVIKNILLLVTFTETDEDDHPYNHQIEGHLADNFVTKLKQIIQYIPKYQFFVLN